MKHLFKKKNGLVWGIALTLAVLVFSPFIIQGAGTLTRTIGTALVRTTAVIGSLSFGGTEARQTASWGISRETIDRFVPFRIALGNIKEELFVPRSVGKMIRVNLETRTLTLYENGKSLESFPIIHFGKAGRVSEIPGGEFRILFKNESHYASSVRAYLPYAMQFLGNYAIHGVPENKNGAPLTTKPDGSIILATDNVSRIFAWADTSTLVSVYGSEQTTITRTPIADSSYFLRNPKKNLSISADAFLVGDIETGEIILEKNSDVITPIASISKLFTADTYLETVAQTEGVAVVSREAVRTEGSNGNLRIGEKIPVETLIYPLLLESSNDGAEVIAEYQGRDAFLSGVNARVQELGLAHTALADPSGLSKENISSAQDLFAFARYLHSTRPEILAVTKIEKHTWEGHTWFNNNPFFAQDRYLGGKTGYTSTAGQTLLSLFSVQLSEFDSRKVAIILLKSNDRSNDVATILNYLKSNVFYGKDLVPKKGGAVTIGDIFYVPQKEEVTMAFVGDMMLDRGVKASVTKNGKGDYSFVFKNMNVVNILRNADIAFGNLEGPASDKGYDGGSIYSFRMDPETVPLLRNVGFDALSVANNHAGDWGRDAFEDTLRRFEENEIIPVGGSYTKPEAETVRIIEKNGIRVGFIGFSDVGPAWLEARETAPGILLANDERFDDIISTATDAVDILVVSFHFGDEYVEHNTRQETLAKRAIDNGAKIVIGHHPHVPQATEEYNGGFIAYSLGNFIFDQSWSKATMEGRLIEITANKKGVINMTQYKTNQNAFFQIEKITEIEN